MFSHKMPEKQVGQLKDLHMAYVMRKEGKKIVWKEVDKPLGLALTAQPA